MRYVLKAESRGETMISGWAYQATPKEVMAGGDRFHCLKAGPSFSRESIHTSYSCCNARENIFDTGNETGYK
jgi:hypothetical protein